jgi:hypothetical protein
MKIEIRDLLTIEDDIRQTLRDHIAKENTSITTFSKDVGIHPYQLLRFLNRGYGVHFETLRTIAKEVLKKK